MIITEKNSLSSIHNPVVVKLHTRLRLQLSHLNKRKFTHGFEMQLVLSVHAIRKSKVTDTSSCFAYSSQRLELFDNSNKITLLFSG